MHDATIPHQHREASQVTVMPDQRECLVVRFQRIAPLPERLQHHGPLTQDRADVRITRAQHRHPVEFLDSRLPTAAAGMHVGELTPGPSGHALGTGSGAMTNGMSQVSGGRIAVGHVPRDQPEHALTHRGDSPVTLGLCQNEAAFGGGLGGDRVCEVATQGLVGEVASYRHGHSHLTSE
ncbi:hypothetical protein [Modestobacter roseus]|uniref:hypothetical protein n=1 Tax=Modestobacter roseus TaxID=1181884 RepID=UPI0012959B0D|nr:hypothetical protein [Modestobacter roseus]MQA35468.1 hypothetical protein [Modestobacter roseus]